MKKNNIFKPYSQYLEERINWINEMKKAGFATLIEEADLLVSLKMLEDMKDKSTFADKGKPKYAGTDKPSQKPKKTQNK